MNLNPFKQGVISSARILAHELGHAYGDVVRYGHTDKLIPGWKKTSADDIGGYCYNPHECGSGVQAEYLAFPNEEVRRFYKMGDYSQKEIDFFKRKKAIAIENK